MNKNERKSTRKRCELDLRRGRDKRGSMLVRRRTDEEGIAGRGSMQEKERKRGEKRRGVCDRETSEAALSFKGFGAAGKDVERGREKGNRR